MKLSVVIPCYNEEKNLPSLLREFSCVIKRSDIELILVNNNSSDNTEAVLKELLPKYSFARYTNEQRQGYGQAVLAGLKSAQGEYIGWTHGDLQTPPSDIIKALNIIEERGNPKDIYIKGDRKGRKLFNNIFTYGMSLFETLYMNTRLWDINAQPNIFPRNFYDKWQNPPTDFALDLYVLYMAKKLKLNVVRFKVVFPPRQHGQSSWDVGLASKWKFIKRTLAFSFKLKRELKKL